MMKKTYETPTAEKIAFQYQEQVAASGGASVICGSAWTNSDSIYCMDFEFVRNFDN